MLEPCTVKVVRTDLRGGSCSDAASLPDTRLTQGVPEVDLSCLFSLDEIRLVLEGAREVQIGLVSAIRMVSRCSVLVRLCARGRHGHEGDALGPRAIREGRLFGSWNWPRAAIWKQSLTTASSRNLHLSARLFRGLKSDT